VFDSVPLSAGTATTGRRDRNEVIIIGIEFQVKTLAGEFVELIKIADLE